MEDGGRLCGGDLRFLPVQPHRIDDNSELHLRISHGPLCADYALSVLGDCRSAAGIVRLRGGCSSFQRVSAPCGSFQFRVFIELGRMDDNFLRLFVSA